ncbi:hypothetical protein AFL01nite_27010 [Aeromicrobium flavum]|uniref:SGNH domain-containing protein n=1 Tax=Aeromicrobium flavum TaxID=416568 RepID=A0A512HY66_9ACTN|nr:SGNH hydrolase domain-containing protein [Aeromicrobium flavum]GEO90374.1 hypothetical protein AFL01nite_27010 [Aeromicrobium flavum]
MSPVAGVVTAVLAAAVLLLAVLSPARADEEAPRLSSIAAAEADIPPGTPACFQGDEPGETQLLRCHYGHRGPRLLAVGDSHMRALSPALRRLAEDGKIRVTLITRSRCGWTSRVLKHKLSWVPGDCQEWRTRLSRYIKEQKDVRAIITHHRAWRMAGTEAQRGPDTVKAWRVALDRRIPVIAVSNAAHWDDPPTRCLRSNSAPDRWENCSAPADEVMEYDWTAPAVGLARQRYGPQSAARISMLDEYCPDGVCRVVTAQGQIMYRDDEHLAGTYTRSLARFFENELRATGLVFGKPPRWTGPRTSHHSVLTVAAARTLTVPSARSSRTPLVVEASWASVDHAEPATDSGFITLS